MNTDDTIDALVVVLAARFGEQAAMLFRRFLADEVLPKLSQTLVLEHNAPPPLATTSAPASALSRTHKALMLRGQIVALAKDALDNGELELAVQLARLAGCYRAR